MNKLTLGLLLLFFSIKSFAQQDQIKFNTLIKGLFENEMLTQRFYKDFLLVKANINKKSAFADLDKSMARFDDNLSYAATYVELQKDIKPDFIELQNYWNLLRMSMLDFDDNSFALQVSKLINLDKLMTNLIDKILKKHSLTDKNAEEIKIIKLVTQNIRQSDKILITYLLDKKFHQNLSDQFNIDIAKVRKNLKKIDKYNKGLFRSYITDLSRNLDSIESLLKNNLFQPKILMSNLSIFSKKNYLIFTQLLNRLKNN